ncbi:hypothetical protein BCR35DRAFT_300350 [Leucosporidium creatinivorum]|uniref:ACB domain-containing protein n=1 Tax=Leucosporidium creatinivorum TaxID=106004 RepID=A0A1Y2G078_9BASI|nr:hypothetical protein BCR35DRAFT_300350 [Leucosporidium creatinivorum]
MSSDAEFERAVFYISSSSVSSSSETKLRIYSLYKIATTSSRPSTSRPGIFDFQGRAKWDSWTAMGSKSEYDGEEGRSRAREEYIGEAVKMGFKRKTGEETIEEVQSTPSTSKRQVEPEAMVRVSRMADEEVDDDVPPSKLHDLAIDGSAEALEAFLKGEGKDSNLNELDAYGFAPIHLATDRGHTEVVKTLLLHGADKQLKDEDGNTPLQLAELAEHEDLIALLKV